jgi:hypothetical protein
MLHRLLLLIPLLLAACTGRGEEIALRQSPEQVTAMLADLALYPQLAPTQFRNAHMAFTEPDSLPVFRFFLSVAGTLASQALVIDSVEPGRRVALASPPGTSFPMRLTWTARPSGTGSFVGVRISYESDEPALARAILGPDIDAATRSLLLRLKEYADESAQWMVLAP